jgi:mono/diheme cytochrome c family protein
VTPTVRTAARAVLATATAAAWGAACVAPPVVAPRHVEATALPTAQPHAPIVEVGDTTFVLGSAAVEVYRNGTLLARSECTTPCKFGSAAAIAAPTGEGRWAVAVDGDRVVHVTQSGELEDVGPRFGLSTPPRELAGAAHTFVAIDERGVAVSSDGVHLAHVPAAGARDVAAARGRVAIAFADHVESWDLAAMTTRSYLLAGARVGFLDAERDGARLVAWTPAQVVIETGGTLHRVALPAAPVQVAVSGARLWVVSGDHVYFIEAGDADAHPVATDLGAQAAAALIGSPTGAVWAAGPHAVARYSPDHPTDDPTWQSDVQPVFARVCAHCHLPGGSAGIDLSSAATWHAERDELRRRVLVTSTMPPAGTDLTDADRHAIETWLGAAKQ